eukprot:CAMPEP_0203746252 /NCGR_PEP_ID=MMETSP0098-20131031/1740_1 /ASSEMBLY_ACC=CAM_ASM_000208 /TAXON_ID=96639 /ORGANISM=" , Strain NY0313808BC1" /LENGTH=356 /DNA_ID=CAMNT_0050634271 /DNA_START=73 /DNA_END=1143 /DNA_ORIENTATION=-
MGSRVGGAHGTTSSKLASKVLKGGSVIDLDELVQDTADFYLGAGKAVPKVHRPSKLRFIRDFVATNRPCIITGLMGEWKALEWDEEKLCQLGGDEEFHVNIAPDGKADCVVKENGCGDVFVKPLERTMTMKDFFEALSESRRGDEAVLGKGEWNEGVPYLSHQNDNLRTELKFLASDIPAQVDLAEGTLGQLDACNLWIGDERSVSAMHLDHYENLYAVVEGEKVFDLFPPTIHPKLFFDEQEYKEGRYVWNGKWEISLEDSCVPWIPVDAKLEIERARLAGHPEPNYAPAMVSCVVQKGEILYLPAMWLHRATQNRLTISVNWWHDMTFGSSWVYFSNLTRIAEQIPDDDSESLA